MSLKTYLVAAAMLAAALPAAGAQAQGGYPGYGGPPPPPYAYGGEASAPAPACNDDKGFTILGAHAGVTVLGFGLNGGAKFTAPADCSSYGYGAAPPFAPRPYAPPPPPPAYEPSGYAPQDYGNGYGAGGYPPPCGCEAPGW